MKKIIFIGMMIIAMTSLLSCTNTASGYEDELRLRILANSDSESDQYEKLVVKKALEKIFKETESLDVINIRTLLPQYLDTEITNKIVIELKKTHFPAKSYDGKFIPAGKYQTILVTIGKGEGKNFWTLLYPEFFEISFEDKNEIEYRSYFYDLFK